MRSTCGLKVEVHLVLKLRLENLLGVEQCVCFADGGMQFRMQCLVIL